MGINQKGNGNMASTGANSPVTKGNNNKINFSKENRGWFFTGLILPVISGLIVEAFKGGSLSTFYSFFLNFFK